MAPLLASVVVVCGLLSTVSSQNFDCNASQWAAAREANCSAGLDLNPQDNTTYNTTLNVCKMYFDTPLLNLTEICYSECQSWDVLYLLIEMSGPQAMITFNVSLNKACLGAVNITAPPPESPNATYALVWTNSSVPEECGSTAEELLLSSVFFSIDVTSINSSIDICLTFFDPNYTNDNTTQPSCVHLVPPPSISYTPKPLPAIFKTTPVAVVNGGLNVNNLNNITYAKVTIDPSTFTQGDTLMVNSSLPTGLELTSFRNGTLTITGEASPSDYTSILNNVLFNSSVSYPASRRVVMTACDAVCCSEPVSIIVELVFFTIEFQEAMAMRQVYLGNINENMLGSFISRYTHTDSLNVTLESRNSVLDKGEYLYNNGLLSYNTPTSSSLLILNCSSNCNRALTASALYTNMAEEPSYYNEAGDLIVRDILVQLLDADGNIISTAMLEVDIVPFTNRIPKLFIFLPCNSTNEVTYRPKRHSITQESYQVQRGHTWYTSVHAPNVSSAILEFASGHDPCLWSITVVFGADTNVLSMEGLGTILHLLPVQLNDAVVGVAWQDKRTLVIKVTGCWLHNETSSVDLVFKPQGESCNDHTPCTRGVCFANGTGCPVQGLFRVQLDTSHPTTLPHPSAGILILCLQFITVGVVITSLLVMWQMVKRRRSSVRCKIGEDGISCVPKAPPQVAINITPPPSKQPSKKKFLVGGESHVRPDLSTKIRSPVGFTSPHGQQLTSNGETNILTPMSAGPPVLDDPPGEGGDGGMMTGDMCCTEQLEEGKELKDVLQEKEPHSLGVRMDACARSDGAMVVQERLVPTVGALQSEGGKPDLRASPTHSFTLPSMGHQMLQSSPQKRYVIDANSKSNSSLS